MAKLVINPTSASKKEIPIASRVLSIGRDPSNDLVLSDSMVSRRHAILEQRDDHYVLRDNNSSNGTLVNGDRVDNEQSLRDGDLVAIGSSRLLFQLEDVSEGSLPKLSALSGDGEARPAFRLDGERRCATCGKGALPSDRFCRGCGAGLEESRARIACPSCGKDVLLPADFCGSCGKPLGAGAGEKDLSTRPHQRAELLDELAPEPGGSLPSPAAAPMPRRRAPKSPRPATPGYENAGAGIRLVASLVDFMILGIPVLVVGLVWATLSIGTASSAESRGAPSAAVPLLGGGVLVLAFLYFFLFWAFRGATPGAGLLGLVVRTEGGETPVGPVRASMRAFAAFLSLLPLGLGLVWVALSAERIGLHDRLSGTRVTRSA